MLKVAKSYGFHVEEVCDNSELEEKITSVLREEGPVLCRIRMKDSIVIQPKVMSQVMPDGSMKSGTLMNLWPFLPEDELKRQMIR